MSKPTDIERMLAHLGLGESGLRYREFDAPDPEKARENWSLLDSAAGGESVRGPQPETPAPVMRPEAYQERIAELRARPLPNTLRADPAAPPPELSENRPVTPAAPPAAERTPLRRLFSRLSGEQPEPEPELPPRVEPEPDKPQSSLSQVFKRLS